MMKENSNIRDLKGIGEKTEKLFQKAGIFTAGDCIRYYPRRYEIYEEPVPVSDLEEGRTMTVTGTVFGRIQVGGSSKLKITTLYLKDLTGTLKVVWFRMPFLRNTLSGGGVLTLRGRVVRKREGLVMEQPEIFYPAIRYEEKRNTLQPVYSLPAGLSNHMITKAVRQVLEALSPEEFLPRELTEKYQLPERSNAFWNIHFPADKEAVYAARKRLVFEEFLLFLLSLRLKKEKEARELNRYCFREQPKLAQFLDSLPYELTDAQKEAWREIHRDMTGIHVMSRLVQGDVGSGKTIVALLAMLFAGFNGYQSALMAPTEVLAKQHYEKIRAMLEERGISLKTELLTGSMTGKEKRAAYERIASGEASLIIGTHALIQKNVVYHRLALVVTDEQHRFGVRQRESLAGKGWYPHILVMSATPIPRTLAMILYGDLDISVMRELPKNRLPVKNCVVDTGYRSTAYQFIKKQILSGRQCYVICPLVEESDAEEAENVMDYAANLQAVLGREIAVGVLHGRMRQEEKDAAMEAFERKELQVLVSTTVIEVGIDVPNATVMLIENAERFGLAQLHQLRGRVGRGEHQSYCIFMSASRSRETKERLQILNRSNDGFFIAEEDLRLRGPGDLFGIRQSGLLDFKLGDVFQDAEILKMAAKAAEDLLKNDPGLKKETHQKLLTVLEKEWTDAAFETTL